MKASGAVTYTDDRLLSVNDNGNLVVGSGIFKPSVLAVTTEPRKAAPPQIEPSRDASNRPVHLWEAEQQRGKQSIEQNKSEKLPGSSNLPEQGGKKRMSESSTTYYPEAALWLTCYGTFITIVLLL